MGVLLKFALTCYIFSLIFSMIGTFIKFIVDVHRWKDREEKVIITPSEFEADLNESAESEPVNEISPPVDETKESEVNDNGCNSDESSEHHTSTIFGAWRKS